MYKTGELKVGQSICDYCSKSATYIDPLTGRAYCDDCRKRFIKRASVELPLRSIRTEEDLAEER